MNQKKEFIKNGSTFVIVSLAFIYFHKVNHWPELLSLFILFFLGIIGFFQISRYIKSIIIPSKKSKINIAIISKLNHSNK